MNAKDAFRTAYYANKSVQREWDIAKKYINEAMEHGAFTVKLPFGINRATETLLQIYGYEVKAYVAATEIYWDNMTFWTDESY